MKRGLVEWDPQELPRETLAARVAWAQDLLGAAGLDAAVLYTSVATPQMVRYFTHFLPYWNQGVLVLPRQGPPVLLVALSNRVVPWIKGSSALEDVRACRNPAAEAGRLLAERGARRVGVGDRGSFPYRALAELEQALAPGQLVDWPGLTAELHLGSSAEEVQLRARARQLVEQALRELGGSVNGRSGHQLAGQLDLALRLGGAEDTLVLVGPTGRWPGLPADVRLGERANVLAQAEYKGHWAMVGRTLGLASAEHDAGIQRLKKLCAPGSRLREVVESARTMHGGALYAYRGGRAAPFVALDDDERIGVGDILSVIALSAADGGTLYGDTFVVHPHGLGPLH